MPREPSTPRASVWRQLRRLGVAQLSDGLVALPADARTREQLEWVAQRAREADGTAGVWLARPGSEEQEREIARTMRAARAKEYEEIRREALKAVGLAGKPRTRTVRALRAELRRVRRRDFFPPTERDAAIAAVEVLASEAAEDAAETGASAVSRGGPA